MDLCAVHRRNALLELSFGKNLSAVTRKETTEHIVTRLYVEGEYGDLGYVGIDGVNPTGLPFLFDFGYYQQIGAFTQTHQAALDAYLADIAQVLAEGRQHAGDALAKETTLATLWGQIDYALFVLEDGAIVRTITGGDATASQAQPLPGDLLAVLRPDGTYLYRTVNVDDPPFLADALYAVKMITRATGAIGGKEVAAEAKEIQLAKYRAQWEEELSEARRENLRQLIGETEASLELLRAGDGETEGLYALMARAVAVAIQAADFREMAARARGRQQELEDDLAAALGDMLRDGYWSNTSYAPGQEESLYLDALDILAEVSHPKVSYTVTAHSLAHISGYEEERFRLHMTVRLWDELLR